MIGYTVQLDHVNCLDLCLTGNLTSEIAEDDWEQGWFKGAQREDFYLRPNTYQTLISFVFFYDLLFSLRRSVF